MKRIFVFLVIACFIASTMQSKKVNCRKYVYAPVCRGVAAKRDIPHTKNSSNYRLRSGHNLQKSTVSEDVDSSMPSGRDKDVDDNSLLYSILRKLDPNIHEDYSENSNYLK